MLHLIDFPHRFSRLEHDATGSIDEVSWITADTFGSDAAAVPRGAVLFVRGWALHLNETEPAHTVLVSIDAARSYTARVGTARHDVAEQSGNPAFAACGFEAVVPTGRLTPGEHRVTVSVLDRATGQYAGFCDGATFTVVATNGVMLPQLPYREGSSRGNIDQVVDESNGNGFEEPDQPFTVSRGARLYVRGWTCAKAPVAAFDEVYAVVDGEHVFRASYGSPRPDIAEFLEAPPGVDALGFEVSIATGELAAGKHDVEVVGVSAGAGVVDRTPIALRIIVGEALPAHIPLRETTLASIDDVVRIEQSVATGAGAPLRLVRGDRLFVRGWAIDESSKSLAAGVVLAIDGTREVIALYGLPRPDVAATLGNDDLTRCGFTAEIASDDLSAGIHTVVCRVLARDGRGAFATAQQFAFELSES
jgi:hypothetical protein